MRGIVKVCDKKIYVHYTLLLSSKKTLENHIDEKKGFFSFCELWTKVFVSYGQRYDHIFFILSGDL